MSVDKVEPLAERDRALLKAAIQLFERYGVKRTSMADIAVEAGVARQTLYNAFRNKDELLKAAIRLHAATTIDAVNEAVADGAEIDSLLDVLINTLAIEPYRTLMHSPNAMDIIAGFNAAGAAEIEAAHTRLMTTLTPLLEPYTEALRAHDLTTSDLADYFLLSCKTAKHEATSAAHLKQLCHTIKRATLRLLESDPA